MNKFKRLVSWIGGAILLNLSVLVVFTLWNAWNAFSPMALGTTYQVAFKEFWRTELVVGVIILLIINGYILIRRFILSGKTHGRRKRK